MAGRFGLWERMRRSAFNAEAYRDVAADRLPPMIGYLAVLIVIATVVMTIIAQIRTTQLLEEFKPWLLDNIPELRVEDGKVSSPVDQPYVLEYEDFGFVLDTTGETTTLDPAYAQGVLIMRTEIIHRRSAAETRRYQVSDLPDLEVNEETWDDWIDTLQSWLWVVVGITTFFWLWIVKIIQVAFWSLMGKLAATLTKRSLTYVALLNIGIYALTIPLVFDLLASAFGWLGGIVSFISLLLYTGSLCWGIFVQPMASEAPTSSPTT